MDERYVRGWNETVLWIMAMTADFGRKEEQIRVEMAFAAPRSDNDEEERGVMDACSRYLEAGNVQTIGDPYAVQL